MGDSRTLPKTRKDLGSASDIASASSVESSEVGTHVIFSQRNLRRQPQLWACQRSLPRNTIDLALSLAIGTGNEEIIHALLDHVKLSALWERICSLYAQGPLIQVQLYVDCGAKLLSWQMKLLVNSVKLDGTDERMRPIDASILIAVVSPRVMGQSLISHLDVTLTLNAKA